VTPKSSTQQSIKQLVALATICLRKWRPFDFAQHTVVPDLKKAESANNGAGRERSLATNYLARKNKKLFGPQRTFDAGHTDVIEQ
jgi:hypothetical protein